METPQWLPRSYYSGSKLTLVPAPDGREIFVWAVHVKDLGSWLGFGYEAVDGDLRIYDGSDGFNRRFVSLAQNPSIALIHEHEVDVKWKVNSWMSSEPLLHLRTLVGGIFVEDRFQCQILSTGA